MGKLSTRPKQYQPHEQEGRYQRFNLKENPFPTEPVNKDSKDRRINGEIYEGEIREFEYLQIENTFLKHPQSDLNHPRLGYICDTSYIGRGNGKSAFLVNLLHCINREYCFDISSEVNKCFALYVTPESGGRTKTFASFVDLLFDATLRSGIVDACLAALRLQAIKSEHPDISLGAGENDEEALIERLNSKKWLEDKGVDLYVLSMRISESSFLQTLPKEFPLFSGSGSLFNHFVTADDFRTYYLELRKRGRERLDFFFSHMVDFFLASGFNGAYILVDDFERIPDFQSGRQRKDFAIELRSCLSDGMYRNARIGFYNMIFVLHAGVPQLISDAWRLSGLENRYPISPKIKSRHLVDFKKLNNKHVSLLLKKYLEEYRIKAVPWRDLDPFTPEAVDRIAELSEYNAGKILRASCDLLAKAVQDSGRTVIDADFVKAHSEGLDHDREDDVAFIEDPDAEDLKKKAMEGG